MKLLTHKKYFFFKCATACGVLILLMVSQFQLFEVEFNPFKKDANIAKLQSSTTVLTKNIDNPAQSYESDTLFNMESVIEAQNMNILQKSLQSHITGIESNVAYYIYDTNKDISVSWNENAQFLPGSVTKMPYALLLLKNVDEGKISLNQTFAVRDSLKAYKYDQMYTIPQGTGLTLYQYLEYLIKYSDNSAMTHLEYFLGGYSVVKNRILTEIGIEPFFRNPNQGTVKTIFEIFKMIYDQSFLQEKTNNLLIDLLSNTMAIFGNRIVAGSPAGTVVAHKIGNMYNYEGLAFSDGGIIYSETNDVIVVVMTKGFSSEYSAAKVIEEITRTATETLM